MNPRTCLLCGKPLSRLRVGGDGDFCSKEHRSQHRLRAGMDRLEEANKVTSLMRRRENPRQISQARLMCNTAQEPRGFLAAKAHQLKTDITKFAPVLPGPPAPRVAGGADQYVSPRASMMAGTAASRRADASRIRINGRGVAPQVPKRAQTLSAKIIPAPLAALRCDAPAPRAIRRDYGMLRGRGGRVYLAKSGLAPSGASPRLAPVLLPRVDSQRLRGRALVGNALRVSIGIGFRIPALRRQDSLHRAAAATGLVWPGSPRPIRAEHHDLPAVYRNLEIGIPQRPTRLPNIARDTRRAQFEYPGSLAAAKGKPSNGAQPAKRSTDIEWVPSEPRSRGMAVAPPAAGFSRRNGVHLFTLVLSPASTRPTRQVAFNAFVPQDPVGCPKVAFEGTVAAAIVGPGGATGGTETAGPVLVAREPAAMVRIEEHFGGGWDDWVGGTEGWRVDVAGVRIGPLALFSPSLELIDYEMEFLARADTKGINWVVRAAGLEEYVKCTLTPVAGGELEFSRCAVIGNVAQSAVRVAQRVAGKPRAAMTVSTRVAGDTFTVAVDGNVIDTWNDDRFPMGGVGFTGAPDDRARLYWVRLASTELTAKEHQNK